MTSAESDSKGWQPTYGILTQTAIESPKVRWTLPARLRSPAQNDIAHIGTNFVTINELRPDGHLRHILRKQDFGESIRNAVVLGDGPKAKPGSPGFDDVIKLEENGTGVQGSSSPVGSSLPPQMLVLVLESGKLVFLFASNRPDGSTELIAISWEGHTGSSHIGYHLAIEPSWHYLVAASPTGLVVLYELESLANMNLQFARYGSFKPIKSTSARAFHGVLQQATFLHPRPEDCHSLAILLLILVRKQPGKKEPTTHMVAYDWEIENGPQGVWDEDNAIISRLPPECQLPIHVIPLMIKSAFIIITPDSVVVVKSLLSGYPEYEGMVADEPDARSVHSGVNEPLWAAWARPFRRKTYLAKTDIIYLAREDGTVLYLEIDSDDLALTVTNTVFLEVNIDTAFAAAFDTFSDVLIVGRDIGPGGVWKLEPRQNTEQVGATEDDWSPVVDMTALNELPPREKSPVEGSAARAKPLAWDEGFRKPDRLFSASGYGRESSITEWRRGAQARIGLQVDTQDVVRQAWTFTEMDSSGESLYAILAMPHTSQIICLWPELKDSDDPVIDGGHFDISSRTLHVAQTSEDIVIQVTQNCVSVRAGLQSSRFPHAKLLGLPTMTAEKAICKDDIVALSARNGDASDIHILRREHMEISHYKSWTTSGEIHSLCLFRVSDIAFIVTGSVVDARMWISVYSLNGRKIASTAIDAAPDGYSQRDGTDQLDYDAPTSICVVREGDDGVDLVLGTRSGRIVNLRVSENTPGHIAWTSDKIGMALIDVFPAPALFKNAPVAFACCDDDLIVMTDFSRPGARFQAKYKVWATDARESWVASPPIHWVHSLGRNLSGHPDSTTVLLLSGSTLLLADLWPHDAPVPRTIPLKDSPTRIIISHTWDCLVVGLVRDDRPTLAFMDAETGQTIAAPCDKYKSPKEYIKGLGTPNDRIFGLYEWSFDKNGSKFCFIVVTTKLGNLVVVSVEKTKDATVDDTHEEDQAHPGHAHKLDFWTRNMKQHSEPIYSIVGDGDGLIYCVDRTIHWDVLDMVEKKLVAVKQFELDSPVTSLRLVDGKILALTTMHSLVAIDHRARGESMKLLHADKVTRATTHMVDVGDAASSTDQLPVTLLSDQAGGITGVWIPWGKEIQEMSVAFNAILASPVRRFVRARTRQTWSEAYRPGRYGTLPASQDGAGILGVSLDGSLQQLTLLNLDLWRFLCLIQNLARMDTTLSAYTYQHAVDGRSGDSIESLDEDRLGEIKPHSHPDKMQIDGDLMKRCFELRVLEHLIDEEEDGEVSVLFCRYLDALEEGRLTEEFREMMSEGRERLERYFELAYRVLAYLVALSL